MLRAITQLAKFGLVGVTTNLAGYLVYLWITYLGAKPIYAMSALYWFGTGLSFYLNTRFTFTSKSLANSTFLKYLLAYASGYLINFSILRFFVDHLGFKHQIVQGGAILVVAAVMFCLLKFWVFKATKPNAD